MVIIIDIFRVIIKKILIQNLSVHKAGNNNARMLLLVLFVNSFIPVFGLYPIICG